MSTHNIGFYEDLTKNIFHLGQKKNSCVSGSPTDPKISGPTVLFFFFKFHSVTTHTQVQCGNNLLPLHPISPVQNLIY